MNSKERLINLLKLLYANTDEEHPLSTSEICEYFTEKGIATDRKTVKGDIELLVELGYDIVTIRSTQNKYFIGSRIFELAELKLLIDAVESSKFITPKKWDYIRSAC